MSVNQTKIFIQRFDEMVNKPNMSIVNEILAPHFIAHVPLMNRINRSNFRGFFELFYTAFPDFVMEVDGKIVTYNQLSLRVTCYGTHRSNFLGIAPTGSQIVMPAICVFQFKDGLAVENWTQFDVFGIIQQMSEVRVTEYLMSPN